MIPPAHQLSCRLGAQPTPAGNLANIQASAPHGLIVALCLWTLYGWTLATPGLRDRNGNLKGTDFLHFYTLGSMAHARRGADLYNLNAQGILAAQRVPEAPRIQYLPLSPPQVSMFFWPLSQISYGWALLFWWVGSACVYGLCCYNFCRACPNLRKHACDLAVIAPKPRADVQASVAVTTVAEA